MVLLKIEIKNFYATNEMLNKHCKTNSIQLQIGKSFNISKTNVLESQKNIIKIKKAKCAK